MKIWITRAEPEVHRTAQTLTDAGHEPLIEPLLQIQSLPGSEEALDDTLPKIGAIAFTSITAVRMFAALRPAGDRDLPVFTVGAATARAARMAGFFRVASAEGHVADLGLLIASRRPPEPVLHVRALEPSGNLVGDLMARGISALAEPIYETGPRNPSPEFLDRLDNDPPEAVMIHSTKGARQLARVLLGRPALASQLTLSAISEGVTEPLTSFAFSRRAVAKAPNEEAMLTALLS